MNTETEVQEKMNLQVDVQETSACERHVTVTIPRNDIERYFSKQFDDLVPKAELPGFRPGRAPRKLVEKKFRKQLADQVKGSILMDSLTQINEQQDFSAISEPELDFEQVVIPDEGDLTYEFNIEVRPEFELPQWKGLKLTRPEHEFTENEIQQTIDQLAHKHSDLVPVDAPVELGDFVVCNITSRHEGNELARAEERMVQVRPKLSLSDSTIDGFENLMVGAQAEETKSIAVEINPFSDNEELRNKSVDIEFEILDVKRLEAKSSEEMAKLAGVESAEKLEDMVRQSLESRLQYAQREQIREQISKLLTESADWELPPDLLQRQSRRELERSTIELRSSGFSDEEIIAHQNLTRRNILEKTETLLKEHFILERIAEEEEIEDAPEDYQAEITRIALQQNDSPRRVRSRLEKAGQMDALRNMIIERKVIDLITENASFKPTSYSVDSESETTAIDFFAAGETSFIPEAKYDGADPAPIPGMKPERD